MNLADNDLIAVLRTLTRREMRAIEIQVKRWPRIGLFSKIKIMQGIQAGASLAGGAGSLISALKFGRTGTGRTTP